MKLLNSLDHQHLFDNPDMFHDMWAETGCTPQIHHNGKAVSITFQNGEKFCGRCNTNITKAYNALREG